MAAADPDGSANQTEREDAHFVAAFELGNMLAWAESNVMKSRYMDCKFRGQSAGARTLNSNRHSSLR